MGLKKLKKAKDGEVHVTMVKKANLSKGDRKLVESNARVEEDGFENFYGLIDNEKDTTPPILRPSYNPQKLLNLVETNNTLGPCIDAMEVNIDGTGQILEPIVGDKTKEVEKQIEDAMGFFKEPYPGKSMTTIRRELRRDLEATGHGYLEVLRSVSGEIVFLNNIASKLMRLIKLDAGIIVEKTVMRGGKEQKILMKMRYRRFAQLISATGNHPNKSKGSSLVYFKEFGAEIHLDKRTGHWVEKGKSIDPENRATEIIQFTIHKDSLTPYGIPRWVSQIPSVLGSRKAEELNLEFFNAGGLPPALIIIEGGTMAEEMRKQLQSYLSGKGSSKHRAAIVEAHATGGSLDGKSTVKVTVEKFGSAQTKDSQFEIYDEKSRIRVRTSFRLPPMFIGQAETYSFATALASYSVAEAQVFQPERSEFDEIINVTIMPEIAPGLKFRSLSLNVTDIETKLKGLGLVKDKIDSKELVETVNEVTDMEIVHDQDKIDEETASTTVLPETQPSNIKKMDPQILVDLSIDWAAYASGSLDFEKESIKAMKDTIEQLSSADRTLFNNYITMQIMSDTQDDFEGSSELCGCASEILAEADCE